MTVALIVANGKYRILYKDGDLTHAALLTTYNGEHSLRLICAGLTEFKLVGFGAEDVVSCLNCIAVTQ